MKMVIERVSAAQDADIISHSLLRKIESTLLQFSPNASEQPFLLHGDYQPSNVHVHECALSGVFDFEWAMGGDPEYEFRVIDNCERKARDTS